MQELKDKIFSKIKHFFKAIFTAVLVKALPLILIVAGIAVILTAIIHFLTVKDGSKIEGDKSNVDYVVTTEVFERLKNISMDNGTIKQKDDGSGYKISIDFEEKIKTILQILEENDSNIDAYLKKEDREEYLKNFIKAELYTQYPDFRTIDNIGKELTEEDEFQGCIKVKLKSVDNPSSEGRPLEYMELGLFNEYILENEYASIQNSFTLDENGNIVVAVRPASITKNYGTPEETTEIGAIDTCSINYKPLIEKYTMPFDFIWALNVAGRNEDFANEIAKLSLGSEIVITAFENYTKVTEVKTPNFDAQEEHKIYTASYDSNGTRISNEEIETKTIPLESYDGVSNTTLTQSYSVKMDVTYVNSWIAKCTNTYKLKDNKYISTQKIPTEGETWINDGEPEEKTLNTESLDSGSIQNYEKVTKQYMHVSDTVDTTTVVKNYVKDKSEVTEKTNPEPEDEEENFVTLFNKFKEAKGNILSAPDWLYAMLETSEKTADMIDLVKYLFYKATGRSYGVTSFDFDVYDVGSFKTISGSLYGSSVEEKVWWALLDAGYSKEAAAGAMGNIFAESGFRTNNVEDGNGWEDEAYTTAVDNGEYIDFISDELGYGLCQWTSLGRKQGLLEYTQSKGVSISDANAQIEYLLAELDVSRTSAASEYANYQLLPYNHYIADDWINASNVEDATRAFCWTFERPGGDGNIDTRINKAKEYFNELKGKEKPTGGAILDMCIEVMNDLLANNVRYSLTNLAWNDIDASNNFSRYQCCCATYVSVVLYRAGALPASHINRYGYNGCEGLDSMLKDAGWIQVDIDEAEPGDICIYLEDLHVHGDEHTVIYAGGNEYWDQTSGCISSKGEPPRRGTVNNWNGVKAKQNIHVWRMP